MEDYSGQTIGIRLTCSSRNLILTKIKTALEGQQKQAQETMNMHVKRIEVK